MRRLTQRKSRLIALTLMLAMGSFILALAGAKRFEPTALDRKQTPQAGITVFRTEGQLAVTANADPDNTHIGVIDKRDTGKENWGTSYDRSFPDVRAEQFSAAERRATSRSADTLLGASR